MCVAGVAVCVVVCVASVGACVAVCVAGCATRVYVLKSLWYGVVKCVLQALRVEKCVVRCGEVCVAGFMC